MFQAESPHCLQSLGSSRASKNGGGESERVRVSQSPQASSSDIFPRLTLSFRLNFQGLSFPATDSDSGHSTPTTSSVSTLSISSSHASMPSSGAATTSTVAPASAAEDHYFGANQPPKFLDAHVAAARAFIEAHAAAGRRVVLVTSGGTTVPLEKQTVRFIDNFSAGTRGATSAEYFLEAGYAVLFLHRQFSLQPYSRHYSHATDCFLDFLHEGEGESVVANEEYRGKMLRVLRKYRAAKEGNLLLMLPFVTITDYLYELRAIAGLMQSLGPGGLLYLAAAVSDFFIPADRMAEHKIQSTDAADGIKTSGSGGETQTEEEEFDNFDSSPSAPRAKRLTIDLDPVPKFLKNLVDGWAPQSMVVSFKLETDPAILVHKARNSLERYAHHLVIGNLLSTRKWEVVFVAPGRPDRWIRVPINRRKKTISGLEHLVGTADRGWTGEEKPLDPSTLPEGEPEMEIESLIVPAVKEMHSEHIASI